MTLFIINNAFERYGTLYIEKGYKIKLNGIPFINV